MFSGVALLEFCDLEDPDILELLDSGHVREDDREDVILVQGGLEGIVIAQELHRRLLWDAFGSGGEIYKRD